MIRILPAKHIIDSEVYSTRFSWKFAPGGGDM
jgi:hypothetical protein